MKRKVLQTFKTLGNTHSTTQGHNKEDFNLQHHHLTVFLPVMRKSFNP